MSVQPRRVAVPADGPRRSPGGSWRTSARPAGLVGRVVPVALLVAALLPTPLLLGCRKAPPRGERSPRTAPRKETSTPVAPRSLTLRVTNPGDAPRYLDVTPSGRPPPACEVQREGRWVPCFIAPPHCTARCPKAGEKASCMECAKALPTVKLVPPRGSIDLHWDGNLYPTRQVALGCECFLQLPPWTGTYKVRVCTHPSVRCDGGQPCGPPDAGGLIARASVHGTLACAEATFTLPAKSPMVEITLR